MSVCRIKCSLQRDEINDAVDILYFTSKTRNRMRYSRIKCSKNYH
jgi:hypothetical protein